MTQATAFIARCPSRPTAMYFGFILPTVLDACVTSFGLRIGAPEGNPLMAAVVHHGGISALWLAKTIGVAIIIGAAEFARVKCHRVPVTILAAISGLTAAVVFNNVFYSLRLIR